MWSVVGWSVAGGEGKISMAGGWGVRDGRGKDSNNSFVSTLFFFYFFK
jgi:hypothetical protein